MWARAFGGNWSNLYMNVTFPLWGKVKLFCTREILVDWYSLDLGETWQNSIGGFMDPTRILVDTLDAM